MSSLSRLAGICTLSRNEGDDTSLLEDEGPSLSAKDRRSNNDPPRLVATGRCEDDSWMGSTCMVSSCWGGRRIRMGLD